MTMNGRKRLLKAVGVAGVFAIFLSGCQDISLKAAIKAAIIPSNVTSPWVVSVGDRSVTLTWAEPSDPDMGAVEITYQALHGDATTSGQVVVAAGNQGATVPLPSNNVAYVVTVYMVDKAGHVANGGIQVVCQFAAQLPVKTVTHFSGLGVGANTGYDTYTYDASSGLPASIVTYDSLGNPTAKHELQYGPGSANKVLDLYSTYLSAWALNSYQNSYFDTQGHMTKREYYSGPPMQLHRSDTYSWDALDNVTGWVSYSNAGTRTGQTSYFVLPLLEQWAATDVSGVVATMGQNDYDSAGRVVAVTKYDRTHTITSKDTNQYDSNGNLLLVTHFVGSLLTQSGYDVYGF